LNDRNAGAEFARPVAVADIGVDGLRLDLRADAAERGAVAARLGVDELKQLQADVNIKCTKAGQYRVEVDFTAEVLQSCVVTLEPVTSRINDRFVEVFADDAGVDGVEVDIDPVGEDPPERVENGQIDVGELVVQYLVLAVDPYPRKADASVAAPYARAGTDISAEPVEDARENPFAALGALQSASKGAVEK
jgi:uncharacterized metal-binding protein YceD (DUF177 family)